ncbi:MAG: hypothetical protein V2I36_02285 [Desulfopila sp.]|nr:hypothetical protein [Desulfopila sp.]
MENGICYPKMDIRPHANSIKQSYLYLSVLNSLNIHHLQKDLEVLDFDALVDLSVSEARQSGCEWILISEEGLSQPVEGISRKIGLFKDFFDEIKIAAYLRRQDYYLESFYSQKTKQKPVLNTVPFNQYIRLPEVWGRADYGEILGWWANVFGEENILIAPFERQTVTPDPLTYLFELTGLPHDILSRYPIRNKEYHVSPSREVTEFFRHMNLKGCIYYNNVLAEYVAKSGQPITDSKFLSAADRYSILDAFRDSNRTVVQKFLKGYTGELFLDPVTDLSNCQKTWESLTSQEIHEYAMPAIGKMSIDIGQLRKQKEELEKAVKRLSSENLALQRENERISILRKSIYRFAQRCYRKIKCRTTE